MNPNRRYYLTMFLIVAVGVLCLIIGLGVADKASSRNMQIIPRLVSVEGPDVSAKIDIEPMIFSTEEAESLLRRFEDEREAERREAERRAEEERRRRAACINTGLYSPDHFKRAGRIWWGDWSWTYYSERILPGHGLRIPGRHTDALGYVRDGNGYLCLASDVHRKGTILETPFGSYGKVYDCGCGNNYTVDVYVNW